MSGMDLAETDLVVDRVYGGSRKGNAGDDPLPRLLGVDNGAGFRHLGKRPAVATLKLLALKTNFSDTAWPDSLDTDTGLFTYYGDNRAPGDLHATPRQGNAMLRNLFDYAHNPAEQGAFPPILLFGGTGEYRDVRFLGLAVPGAEGMLPDEDLVAVWRMNGEGVRFQNYRSVFTALDVPVISRAWIRDAQQGNALSSPHAPKAWLEWVHSRKYRPLKAVAFSAVRTPQQQLPETEEGLAIIDLIYSRYKERPTDFERVAAEIAKLALGNISSIELTRPWRDGGRDATGLYRIGHGLGAIEVEFALEAKCYAIGSGVGVKELSRLLSRLRHRQFGILVTTSYLATQAYKELKEDGHPVILLSSSDIAQVLIREIGGAVPVCKWLNALSGSSD